MKDLRTLGDNELVYALQGGCNDALAVLFERYSRLIFVIAKQILRDDGEAEDMVQQVFFKIYRVINQFDPTRASFKTWLLLYAHHDSMNRRQYLISRKFYLSEDLAKETLPSTSTRKPNLKNLERLESRQLARELLARLKPKLRCIFELIYFRGMTIEEVAEKTGISPGNVRHYFYRGLDKLRIVLNGG